MKTLYIDCSHLADQPHLNTGIQRVVRQTVRYLVQLQQSENIRIQPVCISNGRFTLINESALYLSPQASADEPASQQTYRLSKAALVSYLKGVYFATKELVAALFNHNQQVRNFLNAPRNQFGLNYIVDKILITPANLLFSSPDQQNTLTTHQEINDIKSGDVLILLDASWNLNIWPTVTSAKLKGAKVIAILYDLIPISHSQFCDEYFSKIFRQWFTDAVSHVDGFIGISQTVQHELHTFLQNEFPHSLNKQHLDYFILGADLDYVTTYSESIRVELKDCLSNKPSYLIVSTVEPRKNHSFLLDTFENLWRQGHDIQLVIVGRPGWKVENLLNRIEFHPELNKRLFYWKDLNDTELNYTYQKSKMLLFPSFIEGFGLPIIESLRNGLPVLASDTAIHREVGQDQIGYFSLENTRQLESMISDIEQHGIPESLKVKPNYQWLTWEQSARMLYEKILKISP